MAVGLGEISLQVDEEKIQVYGGIPWLTSCPFRDCQIAFSDSPISSLGECCGSVISFHQEDGREIWTNLMKRITNRFSQLSQENSLHCVSLANFKDLIWKELREADLASASFCIALPVWFSSSIHPQPEPGLILVQTGDDCFSFSYSPESQSLEQLKPSNRPEGVTLYQLDSMTIIFLFTSSFFGDSQYSRSEILQQLKKVSKKVQPFKEKNQALTFSRTSSSSMIVSVPPIEELFQSIFPSVCDQKQENTYFLGISYVFARKPLSSLSPVSQPLATFPTSGSILLEKSLTENEKERLELLKDILLRRKLLLELKKYIAFNHAISSFSSLGFGALTLVVLYLISLFLIISLLWTILI